MLEFIDGSPVEIKTSRWKGIFPYFKKDPLQLIEQLNKTNFNVFKYRISPIHGYGYFVNDPNFISEILTNKHKNYSQHLDVGSALRGGSLIKKQHLGEVESPAMNVKSFFSHDQLESYLPRIDNIMEKHLREIPKGVKLDIHYRFQLLYMDVIGQTYLGLDLLPFADQILQAMNVMRDYFKYSIFEANPFYSLFNIRWKLRYRQAKNTLNTCIDQLIHQNKQRGNSELLDQLLQLSSTDLYSEQQIKNALLLLILGGFANVSTTSTTMTYLLHKNQHFLGKIKCEISGLSGADFKTLDDFDQLKQLDNAIKETMRLYPPIWIMARYSIKDHHLGELLIKKNRLVILSQYGIHRNERIWSHPHDFNPNRFDGITRKDLGFRYFPFGGGTTMCLGRNLARIILLQLNFKLIKKYNIEIDPTTKLKLYPSEILNPREGLYAEMNMI